MLLQPLDRAAIDLVWDRGGYPSHGDYRDSHRLTERRHAVWANDGTPYDPERGAARARADAQDFLARVDDGAVVAFDTELFGHHWHEGVTLPGGGPARRRRRAARRARRGGRAGRPADVVGRGPRPAHLGHRAGLGAALAPSWPRSARIRRARALRELLALQSSDWAFLITHGTAGDYPRERAAGHLEAFTVALSGQRSDELRNLAPQLARWAFVQP